MRWGELRLRDVLFESPLDSRGGMWLVVEREPDIIPALVEFAVMDLRTGARQAHCRTADRHFNHLYRVLRDGVVLGTV